MKPAFQKNNIDDSIALIHGKLVVTATRFKTRFRVSGSQVGVINFSQQICLDNITPIQTVSLKFKGQDNKTHSGRVDEVKGRIASISTNQPIPNKAVNAITTIGKEASTNAECQKANIILNALQGRISLFQNPIVCHVWFPGNEKTNSQATGLRGHCHWRPPSTVTIPLNISQGRAIDSMLRPCTNNDAVQVTVVQGPPGSGKTSVVAGFVQAIQDLSKAEYGEGVYLIAQSNIAVKNMAEKLANSGFMQWKLIVSRDFHFDWCVIPCPTSCVYLMGNCISGMSISTRSSDTMSLNPQNFPIQSS